MIERAEARLDIVLGATHLFEEPGTLEMVADLARGWFERHLARQPAAAQEGVSGAHAQLLR